MLNGFTEYTKSNICSGVRGWVKKPSIFIIFYGYFNLFCEKLMSI